MRLLESLDCASRACQSRRSCQKLRPRITTFVSRAPDRALMDRDARIRSLDVRLAPNMVATHFRFRGACEEPAGQAKMAPPSVSSSGLLSWTVDGEAAWALQS